MRRGLVFIAWLVVTLLIWFLLAVPSFVNCRHSSQHQQCINNLRQLDAAKDQYVLDSPFAEGAAASVSWVDVAPYLKDMTNKIYCPSAQKNERYFSSNYVLNAAGVDSICIPVGTNGGHCLDQSYWHLSRESKRERKLILHVLLAGLISGLLSAAIIRMICGLLDRTTSRKGN